MKKAQVKSEPKTIDSEEHVWTASGGRKIRYPDLEDDHLRNILRDGYRNPWLLAEAERRKMPIPLRPVDKLTWPELTMWVESFASCAIEGNPLAEKMSRLWNDDKPLFFLNLNGMLVREEREKALKEPDKASSPTP